MAGDGPDPSHSTVARPGSRRKRKRVSGKKVSRRNARLVQRNLENVFGSVCSRAAREVPGQLALARFSFCLCCAAFSFRFLRLARLFFPVRFFSLFRAAASAPLFHPQRHAASLSWPQRLHAAFELGAFLVLFPFLFSFVFLPLRPFHLNHLGSSRPLASRERVGRILSSFFESGRICVRLLADKSSSRGPSLNRSQCGGCSTKYDTPTGT